MMKRILISRVPTMNTRRAFLRPLLLAALAATSVPMLQGCFPIVAAGAGGAVMSALDRRTSGTQVEDEGIELRAGSRLREKLGSHAEWLQTSRGFGYVFKSPTA